MDLICMGKLVRLNFIAQMVAISGFTANLSVARAEGVSEFQRPPEVVVQALEQPPEPFVSASPNGKWVLVQTYGPRPAIASLARPSLLLAGNRIDPANTSWWYPPRRDLAGFLLYDGRTGNNHRIQFPPGRYGKAVWSPDGSRFIVVRFAEEKAELWIGEPARNRAYMVPHINLNAVRTTESFGDFAPCQWTASGSNLLCLTVPVHRGPAPDQMALREPRTVETIDNPAERANLWNAKEGMNLRDGLDERLYAYYLTSQPMLIHAVSGSSSAIGSPGNYLVYTPSPNGRYILSVRIVPPFNRLTPDTSFPRVVEVLDMAGDVVKRVAETGIDNSGVPKAGWVSPFPRRFFWRPDAPATLVFLNALDGGDPHRPAAKRDELVSLSPPFTASVTLFQSEFRMGVPGARVYWGRNGLLLIDELDSVTGKVRTWRVNSDNPIAQPQLLWGGDGRPARRGELVTALGPELGGPADAELWRLDGSLLQSGDLIFLKNSPTASGKAGTDLSCYDLDSGELKALHQYPADETEKIISVLDEGGKRALAVFESISTPQNIKIINLHDDASVVLTHFEDMAPEITQARRSVIEYKRSDGVQLSGTLYLPRSYSPGKHVPLIITGYPLTYRDPSQVRLRISSARTFAGVTDALSPIPLITAGYAVLDADMPIIGPNPTGSTTNQLAEDAKAAVETLVAMGIADPGRIGIVGHSYGGLMVALLLESTKLFRAGVAFDGLYDPQLLPFGFQDEERSFWQIPDVYDSISAFRHADSLNTPLLLVHGEADESGAKPIQSELMFEALYNLGKRGKLVILPYEFHTPASSEGTLRAQYEMLCWFNRFLKTDTLTEARP